MTRANKETSKKLVEDTRPLLWIVTIGGLLLAAACIILRFDAGFPWVTGMVGSAWGAHALICRRYLGMAESDHREGGITYEAAKATNFGRDGSNI